MMAELGCAFSLCLSPLIPHSLTALLHSLSLHVLGLFVFLQEGGTLPAIPDWLGWWAQRNGCDAQYAQEDSFGGDVHHLVWTCQGQEGVVQHYKVDDQKHDWPSTELDFSAIAAGDLPTHIEASAIIQEFFMGFTRPA